MVAYLQIQRVLDYIDDNIHNNFTMKELTDKACLAEYYFQHLFKDLVGFAVFDYIQARKIALSLGELTGNKDKNIIDIAFDFGFQNHETYIRQFRKSVGLTPSEYRNNPVPLKYQTKPLLNLTFSIVDMDVPLIVDGIIIKISLEEIKEEQFFYGTSTDFRIDQQRGIDEIGVFYEQFHRIKQEFSDCHHPSKSEIGVSSCSRKKGYLNYYAGKRVMASDPGNMKYDLFILKKGLYLKCSFSADDFQTLVSDCIYKASDYMVKTWIGKSSYEMITNNPFQDDRKYDNSNPFMCERYYEDENREKIPQMDLLFAVRLTGMQK